MMMMANELAEDLVTQILLWLPVVSLLRFKCVCKSWYALITHQNFVRKHLLHNNNNNNSNTHLLLKTSNKTMDDYVVSTISYEELQVSPLTQPLPPQYFRNGEPFGEMFSISVVGSCNGLVCLHAYDTLKVVIWNPTTRETKVVPESNLPIFAPAGYYTHIQGMGFGFDAKTNDYKIINFDSMYECNSDIYFMKDVKEIIYQKEVYSLSTDSWRKVDGPQCFIVEDVPMTYITGMGSWLAYVDYVNQRDLFVLSFDMSDEVFLKTLLPDNVNGQALLVLNESIAMVALLPIDENWWEIGFDIWLLLKVGVKDSWNRLFTIGPSIARIHQPLGFWKNDTMFLTKIDSGQLFLYDPSTQQMTDLQIHGHSDSKEMQLVNYMETLVSIKGGNESEE
ncbi:F-box/kelch-repeat protein At3g23880-like [Corylus avellana]|uniref:F-box/kelch-repeat protein At3g23880-like n=1 Tax=Corylus avellana TaxID=13451 RepID=UPI00286B8130|nr:F-box/kelch-repeat protein At3g23880-like [Corylus avellana]